MVEKIDFPLYVLAKQRTRSITPWSRSAYTASFITLAYQIGHDLCGSLPEGPDTLFMKKEIQDYYHKLEELAGKGNFRQIFKLLESERNFKLLESE
jgi:hypothetical protein